MTLPEDYLSKVQKLVDEHQDKIPKNFDWKSYIARYEDLRLSGINNETMAKYHYIAYGHRENREYHKLNSYNDKNNLNEDIPFDFYLKEDKHLCVSILLYRPEDTSIKFLSHFPDLIIKTSILLRLKKLSFIIRNNSQNYNNNLIYDIIAKIKKKYRFLKDISIDIKYINSPYNTGYGLGHNLNFKESHECDWFLIANDDMGFPNTDWLILAINKFVNNNNLGIIGSNQSPDMISDFANGYKKNIRKLKDSEYIEGSLLLIKSDLYKMLGGFDENIKYFYFEDVDLSLRAKQLKYSIETINIPHQHFRASSSTKVNTSFKHSIIEYNRAYFFSKWNQYMINRDIKNKILIDLSSDGMGDIVDCFYAVKTIINNHQYTAIDIIVPDKIKCLYYFFKNQVNFVNKSDDNFCESDYDSIFSIKDLNFSPPLHTMDLIAAKFGISNFDTDYGDVSRFIDKLEFEDSSIRINNYIVLHLDSQRTSFQGRTPDKQIIVSLLDKLSENHKVVLIGQSNNTDKDIDYTIQNLITKRDFYDFRNSSISDMLKLINGAKVFIGLDSGPSHIAQLLNIPSYVIYGPINPATKIYRYHNSGCWYNSNPEVVQGSYHVYLEPAYHFDLRQDNKFMDIDENKLIQNILEFIDSGYSFDWMPIFDSLRQNQREFLITQMHNPLFKNKILIKQPVSVKTTADAIADIMSVYENYGMNFGQ